MQLRHFFFGLLSLFIFIKMDCKAQNICKYVVYLRRDSIPSLKGSPQYGTAFIAKHNSKFYIVTAYHIAKYMDSKSYIKVLTKNDESLKIDLKDLYKTDISQWQYHTIADLAILEIDINKNRELKNRTISSDRFITKREDIDIGERLKIIGFPLSFGIGKPFCPTIWQTYTVNKIIESKRLDEKIMSDFIYVSPCIQRGNSGSPAFEVKSNNNSRIIVTGIAHGVYADDELDGRPVWDLITPIYYFFDMVEK